MVRRNQWTTDDPMKSRLPTVSCTKDERAQIDAYCATQRTTIGEVIRSALYQAGVLKSKAKGSK